MARVRLIISSNWNAFQMVVGFFSSVFTVLTVWALAATTMAISKHAIECETSI